MALGGVTQPRFPSRETYKRRVKVTFVLKTSPSAHQNLFEKTVAGTHGREMSLPVALGQTTYDRRIGLHTDQSPSSLSSAPVHNTDSISQILIQQ